jgi:predicted esterase
LDTKSNEPLHPNSKASASPVPAAQAKAARTALDQALSLHFRGERASALKSIRKALELDPGLVNERLTGNLAHELTGLPVQEALKSLAGEQSGRELIQVARREQKKVPPSFQRRFVMISFVVSLVVLLGMCIWGFQAGVLGSYLTSLRMLTLETQKQHLEGYDYYALVPAGSPPQGGWPVVVALHGMNGQGSHMLPLAQTFIDQGILFVAPSFGGYEPPGKGPLDVMSRILSEIGKNHPVQARGAVLLGHSQGGTFAYRFSLYYPKQVAGVVTAGAPEFDPVTPASFNMPYVFTWGEKDFLKDFMLPIASSLRNSGFNVRIYIVPNAEHEMTQFAIEKTLALLVSQLP